MNDQNELAGGSPQPAIDGTVLIVDTHSMLAGGLAMVLTAMGCGVRTLKSNSVDDLKAELSGYRFDIVLVRIQPGPALANGLELVRTAANEGAIVAVISESTHELLFAASVDAGAAGMLATGDPIADIVDRVVALLRNEDPLSPERRADLLAKLEHHRSAREGRFMPFETLSRREGEVLRLLMDGMSVNKIAETSFVSVGTVRTQVKAVLRKLGVSSQVAAVALAYKIGWDQTETDLPVDLRFR